MVQCKSLITEAERLDTAFKLLGDIYYFDKNKEKRAMQAYLRGYEVNPNNAKILSAMGLVHVKKKQYNRALKYFNMAFSNSPYNFTFLMMVVKLTYRIGDKERAAQLFKKLERLNPYCDLDFRVVVG